MKNKAIRIDKVQDRRRAFGRARTLVKLALLAVVAVTTLSTATYIIDNISRVESQREAVQAQIAEAEARRQEIEDSVAYTESIEFIEYIARNVLNLVRRDEIIFIMTPE